MKSVVDECCAILSMGLAAARERRSAPAFAGTTTNMRIRGAVSAIALAITPLSGCASGGGGDDGGSPPGTSTPPPSSPPPAGVSTSGGTISSSGVFDGVFRGPSSGEGLYSSPPVGAKPRSSSGGVDDVVITVTPTMGAPTITVSFAGNAHTFDLTDATTRNLAEGFIVEEYVVDRDDNDYVTNGLLRRSFDFDGRTPSYSVLLTYLDNISGDGGWTAIGADAQLVMPSSGTATFDTGFTGSFLSSLSSARFVGRADVAVDFGTGAVSGQVADVDFVFAELAETTPGGEDFGLELTATISGDDFSGVITAIGVDMTGAAYGDFYGPVGGEPVEIGGAFAMEGTGGMAWGGFLGVRR